MSVCWLDYCPGIDNSNKMRYYADASFGVLKTFCSYTEGCIKIGTECVISKSSKQKLNIKSSTEAELVVVDNVSGILM